jgi:hypothetical protein
LRADAGESEIVRENAVVHFSSFRAEWPFA